jgi:hypothetical protein
MYNCPFLILGGTIAKLSSKDSVIVDKVNLLKAKYMGTGNKIFMRTLIDQLKGDEDEESFMRTFMMVLLGTILCPSTSDTVDWKFLYSLTDLATMTSVDWAALSLQVLLNEVANFKKKLLNFPNGIPSTAIYVGGCLPFLAVSRKQNSIFIFVFKLVLYLFILCRLTLIIFVSSIFCRLFTWTSWN